MFLKKIIELYKKSNNIVLFYIGFGISSVVPYILYPHLIKSLGEENFGTILYLQSIAAILGAVIEYGFSIVATRELSQRTNDDKYISIILRDVVYSKVLLTFLVLIVSYIVYIYSNLFSHNGYFFIITYLLGISMGWSFLWFFQGVNKGIIIVVIESISKLFLLASTYYFVNDTNDTFTVLILQVISNTAPNIIGFMLLYSRLKAIPIPSFKVIIQNLYDTKYSFFFRISAMLHTNMPLIFLGLITDKTSVAYYGTCYKLTKNAITTIVNPFWQAIFPKLTELKQNNIIKYDLFSRQVKGLYIVVGCVFSCIIFLFSDIIVSMFFTTQNTVILNTFQVLSFSVVFVLVAIYYLNINLIEGREKKVFYATLINIFCLFLSMLVFKYYKSIGAAFATIVADVLLIITLIVIRKKYA